MQVWNRPPEPNASPLPTERLGCREDDLGRGVEPDATSGSTVSDMEQTWRIGALAAETGLTVRTLHYYDSGRGW